MRSLPKPKLNHGTKWISILKWIKISYIPWSCVFGNLNLNNVIPDDDCNFVESLKLNVFERLYVVHSTHLWWDEGFNNEWREKGNNKFISVISTLILNLCFSIAHSNTDFHNHFTNQLIGCSRACFRLFETVALLGWYLN